MSLKAQTNAPTLPPDAARLSGVYRAELAKTAETYNASLLPLAENYVLALKKLSVRMKEAKDAAGSESVRKEAARFMKALGAEPARVGRRHLDVPERESGGGEQGGGRHEGRVFNIGRDQPIGFAARDADQEGLGFVRGGAAHGDLFETVRQKADAEGQRPSPASPQATLGAIRRTEPTTACAHRAGRGALSFGPAGVSAVRRSHQRITISGRVPEAARP